MPQLDTFILSQLITNSTMLWMILLFININFILINLHLSITVKYIYYFINKFLLSKFLKEVYFIKRVRYIKKIYIFFTSWLLFFKKIVLKTELLDITNIDNIIIENLNLNEKNNIWIGLNIDLKRNKIF